MADITIIDNYKDLSIGDYEEITAIYRDESLDDLEKQVKVICILTGQTEDFILNLPISEYRQLSAKTDFLSREIPEGKQRIAKCYKLSHFELIPVTDIRKVTTAQYIDFQTFHKAGMEKHFVEILSCLLVPKGKKYNQDYDIIEVQDAIRRHLNVYDSTLLYAFFIVSCRESMKDILTFSLQEIKEMPDQSRRKEMETQVRNLLTLLRTNGDGSQV